MHIQLKCRQMAAGGIRKLGGIYRIQLVVWSAQTENFRIRSYNFLNKSFNHFRAADRRNTSIPPCLTQEIPKDARGRAVRSAPRAEALWKEVENVRLVADPATIIGALDFGPPAVSDGAIIGRRVPTTYVAAIYLE